MPTFRDWWREPLRRGYLANGVVPRWSVLVLALWGGAVEAVLLLLLPALGLRWFYDYWRVGGALPLVAALLLGGIWLDRKWPTPVNEDHPGGGR